MTTTTTPMRPETSKALALLAAGHTIQAVAEHLTWPISAIRVLANGQKGWMIDKNGRVYDPSKPRYKAQLPDGVPTEDLVWARGLLAGTPRTVQFQEPVAPTTRPTARPKPSPAPESPTADSSTPDVRGAAAIDGPLTADLPLDHIHDHPGNIRNDVGDVTELADSMRAHGLLQPITVQPHPTLEGHYQLLAGHRRRAAALQAGLATVPAVIRPRVDRATAIELMLVENVQRADLGPIEKAEAYGQLRDNHGYSASKIARQTGLSQSTVSYFLTLLELNDSDKERVRSGDLAVGDAIKGVRRARGKARASAGEDRSWSWEPDYLTGTHQLAKKATRLCEAREHTARRRIGNTACGQCWEWVIREDERVAIASQQQGSGT